MRADISWRTSSWGEAARGFNRVLGTRYLNRAPLGEEERNQVMQMTVSYALANDQAGLDDVRRRYRNLVAETPDKDAFDVVTSNPDRSSVNFRQIATRIAQVDTLDAFIKRYRKDLKESGVGAIN
ncbi:MAG: hypothetical protein FJX65_19665 [Alphaproteobacteria bacterium]|nr:hypothetical protein [Alphaproteobacteria bacterium]